MLLEEEALLYPTVPLCLFFPEQDESLGLSESTVTQDSLPESSKPSLYGFTKGSVCSTSTDISCIDCNMEMSGDDNNLLKSPGESPNIEIDFESWQQLFQSSLPSPIRNRNGYSDSSSWNGLWECGNPSSIRNCLQSSFPQGERT